MRLGSDVARTVRFVGVGITGGTAHGNASCLAWDSARVLRSGKRDSPKLHVRIRLDGCASRNVCAPPHGDRRSTRTQWPALRAANGRATEARGVLAGKSHPCKPRTPVDTDPG